MCICLKSKFILGWVKRLSFWSIYRMLSLGLLWGYLLLMYSYLSNLYIPYLTLSAIIWFRYCIKIVYILFFKKDLTRHTDCLVAIFTFFIIGFCLIIIELFPSYIFILTDIYTQHFDWFHFFALRIDAYIQANFFLPRTFAQVVLLLSKIIIILDQIIRYFIASSATLLKEFGDIIINQICWILVFLIKFLEWVKPYVMDFLTVSVFSITLFLELSLYFVMFCIETVLINIMYIWSLSIYDLTWDSIKNSFNTLYLNLSWLLSWLLVQFKQYLAWQSPYITLFKKEFCDFFLLVAKIIGALFWRIIHSLPRFLGYGSEFASFLGNQTYSLVWLLWEYIIKLIQP